MIEFYGDKLRWFIGIVESNADPLHIGRCRVRVYGIHSDDVDAVPESALPWASCLVPTTDCLLYTSPSPRDRSISRMPSSA